MSATSRAREKELKLRLLEDRYGPFPDPGTIPPPLEEQDPELARLVGWFCRERKALAGLMNVRAVYVSDSDGIQIMRKPPPPVSAEAAVVLAGLMTFAGGGHA